MLLWFFKEFRFGVFKIPKGSPPTLTLLSLPLACCIKQASISKRLSVRQQALYAKMFNCCSKELWTLHAFVVSPVRAEHLKIFDFPFYFYMYPLHTAGMIKITLNSIQPTTLLQRWVGREHTKFVKVCCSKELNLIGPPSSSLGAMARAEALTLQWQWMGNGGGFGLVPISSFLNQRVLGFT